MFYTDWFWIVLNSYLSHYALTLTHLHLHFYALSHNFLCITSVGSFKFQRFLNFKITDALFSARVQVRAEKGVCFHRLPWTVALKEELFSLRDMQKRSMRREVKHSFFFNISRQERLLLTQASFLKASVLIRPHDNRKTTNFKNLSSEKLFGKNWVRVTLEKLTAFTTAFLTRFVATPVNLDQTPRPLRVQYGKF